MKPFTQSYIQISAIIYGCFLLLVALIGLAVKYIFGMTPELLLDHITPGNLLLLGASALGLVVLIQVIAWVICRVLAKVTSVRG